MPRQQGVAVVGGGIAGLAAAWHLSQLPQSFPKVFLLEASPKHWGGWIQSLQRPSGLFELGPRTLRPAGVPGAATLDLVHSLGLQDQLLAVPKSSPAAKNRFLYAQAQLQALPSSLLGLLLHRPAALQGLLGSLLREPFRPRRPRDLQDESIHSFISRRFSQKLAEDLMSAVVHGIYAGNVKELSVRSTLPFLWDAEGRQGSILKSLLVSALFPSSSSVGPTVESMASSPQALSFIQKTQSSSAIYSFRQGLGVLSDTLTQRLQALPHVHLIQEPCLGLDFQKDKVQTTNNEISMDRVISAIPALHLSPLLQHSLPFLSTELSQIPSVTVAVVNMAFDPSSAQLPVKGFGYLVPMTQKSKVLGVIFDSDALEGQSSNGTLRLTAMMGGHQFQRLFGDPDKVSKTELLDTALKALEEHLGLKATLIDSHVSIHRDCIPQYTVGHRERLGKMHSLLQENPSVGKRLSLIGSSYTGVGVNDCILSARRVVRGLSRDPSGLISGLESVLAS